ncbi:fam-j protein [Plasmodium relictum]|uniref:Fam-j protein n=1 Tax=Plasmodium relictum TaxID=85471 RepID=A0A1J1GP56_PLARL|nr:fam-j protein [Plasmodium relictum]CRG85124.1 fam-j protein [Plasmodium relictum]
MEKLRQYLNKPYKKNSLKEIYDFLLEEEKNIMYYYNEASKIFNLNLNDKNQNGIAFNDLINKESTANNLFSLYEILMKLIGGLLIKKQLFMIMEMRKSLLSMNSSKARRYISHGTRQILRKEYQLNLLSQIEKEKYDIKRIQVSNSLVDKINGIIPILYFICNVKSKDKDRTNLNNKKRDNTENVLLALYYANQRLFEVTENEIK